MHKCDHILYHQLLTKPNTDIETIGTHSNLCIKMCAFTMEYISI